MLISDVANTTDVRAALAAHDITAAFRLLCEAGVPQRHIGRAVDMSQSEVSEVLHGRRVSSVWVLERIADGLGVPRALLGLGWGATGRYATSGARGHEVGEQEEVSEDVKRRNFIRAIGATVVVGHPFIADALWSAADPTALPTPLPNRVGASDVAALRDVTDTMRQLARQYGGQADVIGHAAHQYTRLMGVRAGEGVARGLGSALAELHTVAGWASFDSGLPLATIRAHFQRAMELASVSDDTYRAVDAVYHAGMAAQHVAPDDALKLFQIATARLGQDRTHPRSATLRAWLHMDSANSLVMLGQHEQARSALAAARDGWNPADRFDAADMDHVTAQTQQSLGMLDSAARLAMSSVQTWGEAEQRDASQAETTLAMIYLQGGDSRGTALAQRAIDDVAALQSVRARERLAPLGRALAAHRDSTAQDLAQRVHAVARVQA